jgi:general secretion pathway protein D
VLAAILVGVLLVCGSHAPGLEEEKNEKAMPTSKPAFPGSQQVPAVKPPMPSHRITMNFDDADLRDVIKFISDLTGKNFIVDDKVKGKVTIFSPTPITVEEAYQVFLSVLEMKGFTVVESGKITKIVPSKDARYRDIPTIKEQDSKRTLQEDRIITRIIPLNFADANVLKGMLRPMISKDSHIVATVVRNVEFILKYP